MSGFGVQEQWAAGRALMRGDDSPLYRPLSFLHQLTLQGSMLHSPNHDQVWLGHLADHMGRSGASWPALRRQLETMPGGHARRFLWNASVSWWQDLSAAYPRLMVLALRNGVEPPLQLARTLLATAFQIEALAWCNREDARVEPIKVVDLAGIIHRYR